MASSCFLWRWVTMARSSTDLCIAWLKGWDCFQLLQNGSWGPRTWSSGVALRLGEGGIPKYRGGGDRDTPHRSVALLALAS